VRVRENIDTWIRVMVFCDFRISNSLRTTEVMHEVSRNRHRDLGRTLFGYASTVSVTPYCGGRSVTQPQSIVYVHDCPLGYSTPSTQLQPSKAFYFQHSRHRGFTCVYCIASHRIGVGKTRWMFYKCLSFVRAMRMLFSSFFDSTTANNLTRLTGTKCPVRIFKPSCI
jgi:hypothetical protein